MTLGPEPKGEKYSPFETRRIGNKETVELRNITLLQFLKLRIDLTAEVNLSDTIAQAMKKATTKYFCEDCGTYITFKQNRVGNSKCKPCYKQSLIERL